jgi:hypothetical protein
MTASGGADGRTSPPWPPTRRRTPGQRRHQSQPFPSVRQPPEHADQPLGYDDVELDDGSTILQVGRLLDLLL